MRILFCLWIVVLTLTCFGDERIPKQHISTANADNFAVAINPSQTLALIVGKRLISPTAPQNFTVGTIELIKLSNGLSDPSFHEALDPAGNIIRDGDAVPSDAGVIYVNPLKASSNADCSSVAWVSDNEAWAVCKQNSLSGTTTVNIPLFLVRIRPNEAEKVKVFGTNIGVGPDLANKNYYSLASNSLLVDGNYLVVGGGVGSSSLDTKSFLAKFSIASEPPTTAWAPETMMKYGPVNNALSGLAKMTSGSSSYYVTLNRGGGRYFLGKHNSSDLTDVSSSSGVIPGFFSSVQLPSFDVTKMKLNAIMANGSNVYLAGSYDDNAVIVAVKDDGSLNTDFNGRSSTDSAGVLRLKPANQVSQIKGADENIVFGKAELSAIRVTSTGGLIGIGFVSYAPPASVKFSDQIPYYGGLVVELDSTASSTPLINAHVGAPYDWNSTYYRHGEMVGSRLVVAGYKQFFVSAATTGGFYQSFTKSASGYLPAGGVDSCVVVLPKKKFKPSEMRKDIKLFINGSEVTEPAAGALGYLDSNFSGRIGRRSFGRNSDRGVTTLNPAPLPADSCTTDRCSYSEPDIQFILGGKSAYKVTCSIKYTDETTNTVVEAGNKVELTVESVLPVLSGRVSSLPSEKAQSPKVKVTSTEPGSVNFFSDSTCQTPFASSGASSVSAGQELEIAVGSIRDNEDTAIYAQASAGGTLKSACVSLGSYLRDTIAPSFSGAALLTDSPNRILTPSVNVTGYNEASGVNLRFFSESSCTVPIDEERFVAANALSSIRIESGINANAQNPVFVRLRDSAGNVSDCKSAGIFVHDNIPPGISTFRINNGAPRTNNSMVDLFLDAGPDAVSYCVTQDQNEACDFRDYSARTFPGVLSQGRGLKNLFVRVKDQAGNISAISSSSITYETSTVPGAPTNVTGTAGNGQVLLTWVAPTSDGASPISSYSIEYSSNNGISFAQGPVSNTTSATVTNLANGTNYIFRVSATNGVGTGEFSSNSAAVMPVGPPGAPTNVTATPGNGTITISWTAPTDTGGRPINNYAVHAAPNGGASFSPIAYTPNTSITLTTSNGIAIGTSYVFKVAATNGSGYGSLSSNSPSSSPFGPPGAPTGVVGTAGNGQVSLSWVAPTSDGARSISSYSIEYSSNNGVSFVPGPSSNTTSASVTNLTNGINYIFRVAATNGVGTGEFSSNSAAVMPVGPPGAPTNVTATPGNGTITISWTAPTDTGGRPINNYAVHASPNGGASFSPIAYTPVTSITLTTSNGIAIGTSYVFKVAATNGLGYGSLSNSTAAVVPDGPPGAPTNIVGTAGNGQVSLTWVAPASNGGSPITSYKIQYSAIGGAVVQGPTSVVTSATVTGLTNGTSYVFQVAAVNNLGTGSFSNSSASVIPLGPADAPTGITGVSGNGQVSISWVAPAVNGGSTITSYKIQYSVNGGAYVPGPTSAVANATVTGLTNGTTYRFRVAAVNSSGTGVFSQSSADIIPATVPGAPTGVTGYSGNGQVSISWVAPAVNGGSTITSYKIQYSANGGAFVPGPTSAVANATVTGLTNGTSYVFQVAAVNSVGTGSYSVSSAAITPAPNVPGAPTNIIPTGGNGVASLYWTAPTNNGGSPITNYIVQYSSNGGANFVPGPTSSTTNVMVTGLVNGQTYIFRVAALNARGTGAFSSNSPAVALQALGPCFSRWPTLNLITSGQIVGQTSGAIWRNGQGNGVYVDTNPARVVYGAGTSGNGIRFVAGETITITDNYGTSTAGNVSGNYKVSALTISDNRDALLLECVPVSAPGAPQNVVANAGDGQISVNWMAPASNGGSAITDYIVQYSSNGGTTYTTFPDAVSPSLNATVTGLQNGLNYIFKVAAKNAIGIGSYSASSAAVVPRGLPGVPSIIAANAGDRQVSLSWVAPVNNGSAITDYTIQVANNMGPFPPGGPVWSTINDGVSSNTSAVVTGLTNGSNFIFRVAATNAVGMGSYSSNSVNVVPRGVPFAPTNVVATPGNAQATIGWAVPSPNGSSITAYSVQYSSNNGASYVQGPTTAATSVIVSGLTNGTTYLFKVAATNIAGMGPYSSTTAATLPMPTYQLTITNSIAPNSISSGSFNCTGSACNYNLNNGASVALNAAIPANSGFLVLWTGCDSVFGTGNSTCQILMTRSRSVSAEYIVPVYRKKHVPSGDYLFTRVSSEGPAYTYEGVGFYLYNTSKAGRIYLYRCLRSTTLGPDHFLSTDANCENYTNEGPLGYVTNIYQGRSLPTDLELNRYQDNTRKINHFTRAGDQAVPAGFFLNGPQGYVPR